MRNWVTLIITFLILFFSLELLSRGYCQFKYRVPFLKISLPLPKDAELGWKGKALMGNPQSSRMKIFFVGDSFTSNYLPGKMYFAVLQQHLDIELFVYGGGGYGTLQEYLVINKYIEKIKPDLIVLQVCSNDFINNTWNLERKSYFHVNYRVRPYYENKEIHYRFPRGLAFLRQYLIPYSRAAYLITLTLDQKFANLAKQGRIKTIENEIERQGLNLNEFKQSVNTTFELIKMIKKRCGTIPIIAFPVFDDEPYFTQFKTIFNAVGIDFLVDIPQISWNAEKEEQVRNYTHWGKEGHAACGIYLANYIKTHYIRPVPDKGR